MTKAVDSEERGGGARRKQSKPIRVCSVQEDEDNGIVNHFELCSEEQENHLVDQQNGTTEPGTPESFPTKYHALGSAFLEDHELSNGSAEPVSMFPDSADLEEGRPVTANRIFHQEAFCDLCQREFCNKYFLKTHMAIKHNIRDEEEQAPLVSTLAPPTPPKETPPNPPLPSLPVMSEMRTPMMSSPQRRPDMEDYCDICQKHFCNKYYLKKHRQDVHGITPDPCPGQGKRGRPPGQLFAPPPPVSTVMNVVSSSNSLSHLGGLSNVMLLNPFAPHMLLQPQNLLPHSFPPQPSFPPLPPLTPSEDSIKCEVCHKEFSNAYFLRAHQANKHHMFCSDGAINIQPSDPDEHEAGEHKEMCVICCKDFPSKYNLSVHMINAHNIGRPDFDLTPPRLGGCDKSREKVSLFGAGLVNAKMADRVLCELCNKDVCNKYFLKTHKVKVHNMHPDDVEREFQREKENNTMKPPEVVKVETRTKELAQRGIDPEAYCDICKKEFCSKYFLKTHCQKQHGGEEVRNGAESPVSSVDSTGRWKEGLPKSPCHMCSRTYCNKYFLKMHLLKRHGVISSPTTEEENVKAEPEVEPQVKKVKDESLKPISALRLSQSLRRKYQRGRHIRSRFQRLLNEDPQHKMFRCVHCASRFPTRPECLQHIRATHPHVKATRPVVHAQSMSNGDINGGEVIMQSFHLESQGVFAPAIVVLPVYSKVLDNQSITLRPSS